MNSDPVSDSMSGLAERLGALAHPARLEILSLLAANERCCCKDVVCSLDLAQSTVSQHLKVLVEAGLVRLTPHGQRSLYTVDREALAALSRRLADMVETCCAGPGEPCVV